MVFDNSELIKRLAPPRGIADAVLDTDAFNEVDDQFALAYMIRSDEKIRLKAVYAAPFLNHHSSSAAEGMERSFREILHIYELMDKAEYRQVTFPGAKSFLKDDHTPVLSPAVTDLIQRSSQYTKERPLYVVAIAAATNVASALLLDPTIKDRIVVLWHGGLSYDWPDNQSFNCGQDTAAARVLMDSGVPLVQFPGKWVTNYFYTSGPELDFWLKGKNKLCDYLIHMAKKEAAFFSDSKVWSRCLFDVVPVSWLLDEAFTQEYLEYSPVIQDNHYYSVDKRRHFIKYVYAVDRDRLMNDLFEKLSGVRNYGEKD